MNKNSNVIAMKNHPSAVDYPLKVCPFCGSPAQLYPSKLFAATGCRAQCTRCSTGATVMLAGQYINYRGEHDKTFTDDEAAAEAARIWNERAEVAQ